MTKVFRKNPAQSKASVRIYPLTSLCVTLECVVGHFVTFLRHFVTLRGCFEAILVASLAVKFNRQKFVNWKLNFVSQFADPCSNINPIQPWLKSQSKTEPMNKEMSLKFVGLCCVHLCVMLLQQWNPMVTTMVILNEFAVITKKWGCSKRLLTIHGSQIEVTNKPLKACLLYNKRWHDMMRYDSFYSDWTKYKKHSRISNYFISEYAANELQSQRQSSTHLNSLTNPSLYQKTDIFNRRPRKVLKQSFNEECHKLGQSLNRMGRQKLIQP